MNLDALLGAESEPTPEAMHGKALVHTFLRSLEDIASRYSHARL